VNQPTHSHAVEEMHQVHLLDADIRVCVPRTAETLFEPRTPPSPRSPYRRVRVSADRRLGALGQSTVVHRGH